MATVTGAIPTDPSPQLNALLGWIEALSRKDYDAMATFMTSDYLHYVLPQTYGGTTPKPREEIMGMLKEAFTKLNDFKVSEIASLAC